MKRAILFILVLSLTIPQSLPVGAQTIIEQEEKTLCAQLSYLKQVKQQVAKDYWPDFGRQEWDGEIRIMTEQSIFIVNPEKTSLEGQQYKNCVCSVANVVRLKDTVNTTFVMNTNFYDGTAACSDWSISHKILPGVDDTESWILMVLHEMFHQYQINQPAFRQHFIDIYV